MTDSTRTPAKGHVVVVGNLTIDDVVLPDGQTLMGRLGGNTVHSATAVLACGVPVAIVTRKGEDFPAEALDALAAAGADVSGVVAVPGPTVRNWVIYESDGSRHWLYRTPPARSAEVAPEPADITRVGLEGAAVVHVAAMPLANAERVVAEVRRLAPGALITLDTHEDWVGSVRERLLDLARSVDVFEPSLEELQELTRTQTAADGLAALAAAGLTGCVVKAGCRRRLPAGGRRPSCTSRHWRPAPSIRRGRAMPSAVVWPLVWPADSTGSTPSPSAWLPPARPLARRGACASSRPRWTRRGCARPAGLRRRSPGRSTLLGLSARPPWWSGVPRPGERAERTRRRVVRDRRHAARDRDDPRCRRSGCRRSRRAADLGREIDAGSRHLAPVADRVRRQCLRRSGRRPGLPTAHGRHAARQPRARPVTLRGPLPAERECGARGVVLRPGRPDDRGACSGPAVRDTRPTR